MLIMATLPSTLILYLWAVLVGQWQNRLCLSETRLKWQHQPKVLPNARCVTSYDFSMQMVNVQRKFTNKLWVFMVTLWFPLVSSPKETSRWEKVRRQWWGARRSHDMVQRAGGRLLWLGTQKLVLRLNKCLDNASDYVEK